MWNALGRMQAPPPAPTAPPAAPPARASPRARIAKLKGLLADELISELEFQDRKKEILAEI